MTMRENILKASDWLLPPAMFRLLSYYRPSAVRFFLSHRDVLRANRRLLNRHAGERCFIMCNGPSLNEQDIRPLRDEIVFSVSNGYQHPDFGIVRPRYHCLPQITYENLPEPLAAKWLGEMHERLYDAEVFLNCSEMELVQRHGLFSGRVVNYVCMGKNYLPANCAALPDISGIIPRVQTVPVMVLMIALYMGFKRIYLLGTDHDWFVKKEYKYFFDRALQPSADTGVRADGVLETTLWDELPAVSKVWGQYRALKRIAAAAGAQIYNATHGGMLDEFERVRLEDLFRGNV